MKAASVRHSLSLSSAGLDPEDNHKQSALSDSGGLCQPPQAKDGQQCFYGDDSCLLTQDASWAFGTVEGEQPLLISKSYKSAYNQEVQKSRVFRRSDEEEDAGLRDAKNILSQMLISVGWCVSFLPLLTGNLSWDFHTRVCLDWLITPSHLSRHTEWVCAVKHVPCFLQIEPQVVSLL